MTVFMFTDKAQKLLGEAKGNLYFDVFLVLTSIAFLLYAVYSKTREKKRSVANLVVIGLLFLVFSISWFNSEAQSYKYLRKGFTELNTVYHNQEYKIVEGNVEVLHEEPEGGHDKGDIIHINGVEFELSCFSETFGYNRTIVFGGVLTEGTFARVYYYQTQGQSSRAATIMQIDMLEKVTNPIKIDPLLPCAGY